MTRFEQRAWVGPLLVELERLERAQEQGVFLVDQVTAEAAGARLRDVAGVDHHVPSSALAIELFEKLRASIPGARPPAVGELAWVSDPNVQVQWAQLHYALGAYETSILWDAGEVRLLDVRREEATAVIRVRRGDKEGEHRVRLDAEVDMGIADGIAFGR